MASGLAWHHELMLGPGYSFDTRAKIVTGPLAPLARSLAADLDRVLPDEDFFIPAEKARMSRKGGRCENDGTFLEFDPTSPRRHRCPTCGAVADAEEHYRWWIMGYQLWLSERAVQAAALGRLTHGGRYQQLAESIVTRLAERYQTWPNEDNVLGPTRVFFSTYLESIWLLQLSTAVMLLEHGTSTTVGALFRERIALPSSAIIRDFNEGLSNRQVWNSAALGATAILLARPDLLEQAIHGPGGLREFLKSGLLSDGSWYEGENYHLFAHRGLWFLVRLAEQGGVDLPDELLQRFTDGFVAPLKTALPDFTFPSRRDSQYGASLRQWRIAESLELGLSRTPGSIELAAGLTRLYREGPEGDSQRWRSTGEAERNVPGVRLTRADLGWKSLLFALPSLPDQPAVAPRSALMEGQGFGVIRRDAGQTYIALDYGHTGGGHGHPDRLNLWLVRDNERVFEDVGTGSYVERALHWYRSTLAHNAPLVDGRSQDPVAGSLRAWNEHGEYAWIDAEAFIAPDVLVRRSIVVASGYLIDRVAWTARRAVTFDLPMHVDGKVRGAEWKPAPMGGASGLEDGFDFVTASETSDPPPGADGVWIEAPPMNGYVRVLAPHAWWRAVAPGPPGHAERRFLLARAEGREGQIISVWSWGGEIGTALVDDTTLGITTTGGHVVHRFAGDVWRVRSDSEETLLDGRRPRSRASGFAPPQSFTRTVLNIPFVPPASLTIGTLSSGRAGLRFHLGERNYRRTEATWVEAGSPEADVVVAATPNELLVEILVRSREPNFMVPRVENPLDNEHPDTNSDGVQLHLALMPDDGRRRYASWLLVPVPGSPAPRIVSRDDAGRVPLAATWQPTTDGWQMLCRIPRASLGPPATEMALDVIVNEMPRGRERRRGQLVLSAKAPGWAYLRGDRQDVDQLIPMTIEHV
jgi:hypothetical protein